MPKSKKKAHELTTDEVMRKVFKPTGLKHIKAHVAKIGKKTA